MIEINEKFSVAAVPDEVYAVLSDPHAVVECVSGAELGEQREDGSYHGTMTVKFSALRVKFAGKILLELDREARWGKVVASGRDGQGGTKFQATAEFTVVEGDDGSAVGTVSGQVELNGKLASVIENAATAVVRRMTADFVEALSMRCASSSTTLGPAVVAPAPAAVPAAEQAVASPGKADERPPAPAAAPAAAAATVGVLLLHDFGSSPSGLRPWGEAFAAAGMAASIPRLAGHGTRWTDLHRTTWQDWYDGAERALSELKGAHDQVFVMGLGLGATLALRLAEQRAGDIAGVVAVNPMFSPPQGTPKALGLMRYIRRSVPAAVGDIRKPGVKDVGYDRTSLRAAHSLAAFGALVRAGLRTVKLPVLAVTSGVDHVVAAADLAMLVDAFSAEQHRHVVLPDSYHVATLDNDAPTLFSESVAFVNSHALVSRP
ncbi:serine aminopeptidase domain-containing protein [Streptomyces sp. NBC_00370]|uniref:serine aminopeptidase domain-containing protein n=2 Tax=unclassified Streptomyces TaxID=2593676 RepID=UPI002E25C249